MVKRSKSEGDLSKEITWLQIKFCNKKKKKKHKPQQKIKPMAKKKTKPCTLKRKGGSTNLANSEVLNFLKFSVEIRKQVQPHGHSD